MAGKGTKGRRGGAARPRRWVRRLLGAAAATVGVVVLAGAGIAGGVLWYYGRDLPDLSDLREGYRPPQVTRIESSDGILLGEIFAERRIVVPFERIPRVLVEAVLAAEDADFYQHEGLDYPGMLRALFVNLREGSIRQGASTITQQVVQTFYVGRERTWSRKVRELLLARRLEQHLTKDEILFLYLNQINFGHARYGVQSASRFYFGHGVEEVTLEEAALLAGLPRGPAVYSPRIDLARARARRDWVLGQMERKGFATAEAVAAARAAEVRLGSEGEPEDLVPEIMVRVRQELVEAVGDEEVRLGGYVVRTTIDSRLQKAARRAVRDGLEALDGRHEYRVPIERRRGNPHAGRVQPGRTYLGRVVETDDREGNIAVQVGDVRGVVDVRAERRYNPEGLRASRAARAGALVRVSVRAAAEGGRPARLALELGPQAALVALEPETGRVRAIVGGYAPRRGDFDRATQARRQPGSSFKPIVYSLALNGRAVTPATLILDAPEVFDQWRPTNFETWSYEGHVRLRTALAKSINLVAVRLIQDVGPEQVASYARELGIESPLEAVPTLALGASAVTPLEMARAYAVFASGGLRAEPRIVEEIRGPDGRPHDLDTPETIRVIEPANAYLITSMLRSVVQNGTARDARVVGDEVAGKTGTSNDAQDAWFVGYARGLTCAVWVGFDEPRSLGRAESGSRAALPIWVSFMRDAPAAERLAVFTRPEGVVTALIDPESGLLAYEGQADAIEEEFLDGTVPTAQAIPPDTADPDTFLIEQTGDGAPAEDGNPNHPAPTASPSRGE